MNREQWILDFYNALGDDKRENYALVSLKIKRLRLINRVFNRAVGDTLIEQVLEIINQYLKPGECATRIYGNYFNLIIHASHTLDDYEKWVDELAHAIRDIPDDRFFGKVFVAIGIYNLTKEPMDFYLAQYKADITRSECPDNQFRNTTWQVYGMQYQEPTESFWDLGQKIGPALERGDFKLYLQPKVDLITGQITSAEALMRWIDPVRGNIPLSDFLPGLEKDGMIEYIDHYIFNEVCKNIENWLKIFGKKIKISVNLSKCAFNYHHFFSEYSKIFEKYQLPKDCIEIELLESIVLNQVDAVREVVDEICDYGFSCALDDFGSGYSSYSVLTNTKISTLKIDRSLFSGTQNQNERTILRHIIQTAHELNMHTVGEGVETQEYVDYLRELGCSYIQGYVFYKPMPVSEFEARFVQGNECVSFE